jgi:hypothetical protein
MIGYMSLEEQVDKDFLRAPATGPSSGDWRPALFGGIPDVVS